MPKIKRHEDNIKFLQSEINRLSESILDLQVSLGKHLPANGTGTTNESGTTLAEKDETEQILRHEKSAASLLCRLNLLKSPHTTQALNLALTKDVLGIVGIVATLGRVDDDNLSRTYEGVKVLEKYDADGTIISTAADDPQRKLSLPKPKLPNGECPPAFLDYAVNTINLDDKNLDCLTSGGHGLRETLFYSLFSRLQIYRTRAEMHLALPCINDGALSLDGGVIKKSGVFILGSRKDIEVKFPATSGESSMSAKYLETEDMIKKLKWERSHVTEDMQREQELLDFAKANFTRQKHAGQDGGISSYNLYILKPSWFVTLKIVDSFSLA
ncbi:defective in meristem silencing 3 [Prunus dulcis]|uniref:Defective in meristem silencing 3 n=1 Tax=Prunus dulcis TaxID=3755 RepID=A0A4Y1R0P0_PRUDU|nr:defective in meristem silencing 3 [Prunus dulcis]